MIYADYEYYVGEYYGNAVSEDDFPRAALRASQYIDYITQGRAKSRADMEEIKMACCALAEQYQMVESAQALASKSIATAVASDTGEVQSEAVGSWSKSYRSGGDSAQAATQAAADAQSGLYAIAQRYLGMTGLLYRGGGRCRCRM